MTQSFTQVPPDSTGGKLDMRSRVKGANTLLEQGVYFPGVPTFRLLADSIVPATNKYHIVLHNNTGSAQTLWLTGLYALNLNLTAVTGVVGRFDLRRTTGVPTLTALTPAPFNTDDPALAGVTAGHTATAGLTDSTLLLPFITSSEELTASPAGTQFLLERASNLLQRSHPDQKPIALRPGQGIAVKQNNAGAVGALTWILDFCVEPD